VRDSTGAPVRLAVLQSNFGQKVAADDSGRFSLIAPATASVTIEVKRIGFQPIALRFDAGRDTIIDVVMIAIPQLLPQAQVKAAATIRSLELRGFYRRLADQNRGILNGEFVTAEEIEQRSPPRITWMIDGLQGVRVVKGRRQHALAWDIKGPGGCMMNIYVDGIRMNMLSSAGNAMRDYLDELISPTSVAGIEVYGRLGRAPPQYQSVASTCGVVLIWTR
jgi:hypothetical protein